MKKIAKVLSISLIAIMMMSTLCLAVGDLGIEVKANKDDVGELAGMTNTVLGVLQWAGIAIAVGMLIFLGIKYISKGVSEQAEIKKSLPIYILGVVLIFGASMIVGAIRSAMGQ